MRELNRKIEFLRTAGVSQELAPGVDQAEVARAVGIAGSTWSAYAGANPTSNLPSRHHARLGELYGFDATWPEWQEGTYDEFRRKYLEHHGINGGGAERITNIQQGTAATNAPVINLGPNAQNTFNYNVEE